MTSIRALSLFIGDLAYGEAAMGLRAAEALHGEGYIGAPDSEATPGDAARMLVALMATDLSVNMGFAADRFAATPLRLCVRQLVGQDQPEIIAAEDVPIEPGEGPEWNRLSHSFVGALAYLLELEAGGAGKPRYPTLVSMRRTLGSPLAKLQLLLGVSGGVKGWLDLWYAAAEPGIDSDRMLVAAEISPATFRRVALFVQDGGAYARFLERFATPAPQMPSAPISLAGTEGGR